MPDNSELPTVGELISNWLGVQLPAVTMPQTLKNIDKAIAKIILAGGENLEARIKGNAAKARATNKINLDGLFRTEEEKRKLENRAAATKAALEDIDTNPAAPDAPIEIDDDWLNFLYVRRKIRVRKSFSSYSGRFCPVRFVDLGHSRCARCNLCQLSRSKILKLYHDSYHMRLMQRYCHFKKERAAGRQLVRDFS